MSYNIKELLNCPKNNSEKEQTRARNIFLDLKDKVSKDIELTEHEKVFLWTALKITQIPNDGLWSDFPILESEQFKYLYLSYVNYLTEGGGIVKTHHGKYYIPAQDEINIDLDFLKSSAAEWESIVNITNHQDLLLQETSTECRTQIRDLDKQLKDGTISEPKHKDAKFFSILLSKYIYYFIRKAYEKAELEDFAMTLNGIEIEFTEYSFIHILTRHFAKSARIHDMNKTFHNLNFNPECLSRQVKKIIRTIDNSRIYLNQNIDSIYFTYNNTHYVLWTALKNKAVKNKGNITYRRIQSLYPIDHIPVGYSKKKIGGKLFVYFKTT